MWIECNRILDDSLGCTCKKTLPIQTGNVMCRWAAPAHETNADFGNAEVHNGFPCKCPGQAPENQDAIALKSHVKYYPGNRFVSFVRTKVLSGCLRSGIGSLWDRKCITKTKFQSSDRFRTIYKFMYYRYVPRHLSSNNQIDSELY